MNYLNQYLNANKYQIKISFHKRNLIYAYIHNLIAEYNIYNKYYQIIMIK